MAKANKKVSIALFDKTAKEYYHNEAIIRWHEVEVRVKYMLPLTEMLAFVDDVVDSCFHDGLGYMPEVKDFAIKSNILTRYANFSMPESLEHRYQMVYGSDIVDFVCTAINTTQLQEIVSAINSKIRFLCDSKAAAIETRVNDIITALEEMRDKTMDIFNGVSQEDLKNIMSAIANGSLDEQKIVQAYLKEANADVGTAKEANAT